MLLAGVEPSLRWRGFTEAVADLMRTVGAKMSITIGAQPAAVPHTRPLSISLSASHPDFEQLFDLQAPESRYQGATGITGVLNLHHRSLNWRNASLWALAPHYLTMGPNPNVVSVLVKTLDHGFHTSTPLGPLDDRLSAFSDQVAEAMGASSEAATYVRQLEEQYDANEPAGGGAGSGKRRERGVGAAPRRGPHRRPRFDSSATAVRVAIRARAIQRRMAKPCWRPARPARGSRPAVRQHVGPAHLTPRCRSRRMLLVLLLVTGTLKPAAARGLRRRPRDRWGASSTPSVRCLSRGRRAPPSFDGMRRASE